VNEIKISCESKESGERVRGHGMVEGVEWRAGSCRVTVGLANGDRNKAAQKVQSDGRTCLTCRESRKMFWVSRTGCQVIKKRKKRTRSRVSEWVSRSHARLPVGCLTLLRSTASGR
jgi:hypothetical protein